jgi:hypothetical protein
VIYKEDQNQPNKVFQKPGPLPGFSYTHERKLQDDYVLKALSKPYLSPTMEPRSAMSSQQFFTSKAKKKSDADFFFKGPSKEEEFNIFQPVKTNLLNNIEQTIQENHQKPISRAFSETSYSNLGDQQRDKPPSGITSPKHFMSDLTPIPEGKSLPPKLLAFEKQDVGRSSN